MSLNFQPFQDTAGQEIRSQWANSIDGIFKAYQQAKQNSRLDQATSLQQQLGAQQLAQGQRAASGADFQESALYGRPLSQFTPGQMTEAAGNGMSVPGTIARPGSGPVNPDGSVQQFSDPAVAQLHAAHMSIRAQREAQMAEAQAMLGKTQAEARKTNSEADINAMFTGAAGQGPLSASGLSTWAQSLRDDVASGRKSPSQAQAEASRLGPQGIGRLIVDKALAGLDQTGLEAAYHKKTATAGFEGGEAAQKPARLMKSLIPSLDYLTQISKNADNNSWKMINKLGIKVAAEKGDSHAQELLDASSAISDEFQAMIGGGSNAKLELGMHLFESAKTPEQIARSVNFIKQNLNNRSEALLGKESGTPIKTLEQNQGAPTVGTVSKGYRFKGGDPAVPTSWEKQ